MVSTPDIHARRPIPAPGPAPGLAAGARARLSVAAALSLGLAVAMTAGSGCYRPGISDGQFQCGTDDLCPPGFACNAAGVCVKDPDAVEVDAAPQLDAGPEADAPPPVLRVGDPLVLYDFAESPGDGTVKDQSDVAPRLDLTILDPVTFDPQPELVTREPGVIRLSQPVLITTEQQPTKLFDVLKQTRALTLEAWIDPDTRAAGGPRRILALSVDTNFHHLLLAHGGDNPNDSRAVFNMRLRTSDIVQTQGKPQIETPDNSVQTRLTHLVYTRSAGGDVRGFIDGEPVDLNISRRTGNFDVWDEFEPQAGGLDYLFGLGNELTGDRTFQGRMHLIAIYSRPLSPDEVRQNFQAGPDPELNP